MAIMFEPKGDREVNSTSSTSNDLPLGQKPEGELNSFLKMQNAFHKLLSNIDLLEENLNKLKQENKRLKDALGITEVEEPLLVLTKDMEVTDGSK